MADRRTIENSVMILERLLRLKEASQVELTKLLPLKRTSVFYIFEFLKKSGLLSVSESSVSRKGRPSQMWSLNPEAGIFVVVYFNNVKNYFAFYDFSGSLISLKETTPSSTLEENFKELKKKSSEFKDKLVCGAMLAVSGSVDSALGEIVNSRIWGANRYPAALELEKIFGHSDSLLTGVENNSNLAAWGEKVKGVCKGFDSFMTLHVHEGSSALALGSGLVLEGRLFRGERGGAGELDKSYYRWLEERFADKGLPKDLDNMNDDDLKIFASEIAVNLANIVNYLTPQKLVLIRNNKSFPEAFVNSFRSSLQGNLITAFPQSFPVETSTLGAKAVLEGGLDILMKNYFNSSQQLLKRIADIKGG
jgi:predicted NBD/HSP70 family sugar kinase